MSETDTGDPQAYALAYETGLRTLDEQAGALGEIRDRTGRLLTTATIKVFVTEHEYEIELTFANVEHKPNPPHTGRIVRRISIPNGAAEETMQQLMSLFARKHRAASA